MTGFSELRSREDRRVLVVVDTPRGSRNKYRFDERRQLFELAHVLPAGAVFPYNFGWVPGTRTGDGDPIDVMLLLDAALFTGCVVPTRLVGVLEAEQAEHGRWTRNDRLIGVADASSTHQHVRSLADLDPHLVRELEHFFTSYNAARQREFRVTGVGGPQRAATLLAEAEVQPRGGTRRKAVPARAPRPRSKRKVLTTARRPPSRRRRTSGRVRDERSRAMAATKRSTSRKSSSRKSSTGTGSGKSSGGRRYGKKAGSKVEKAMHERKRGTLRSGSGKKVTSRKQAIAIGLSEARKAGAKVPSKSKK